MRFRGIALALALVLMAGGAIAAKPNIVIIYIDDLGYADVGCYGATKVATPHVDQLAQQGLLFTDAHAAAATCTPSRFAMLSGEYAFRKHGTGVLPANAPLCIDTEKMTLPSMLEEAGYATGCVGKWHLGLGDGNVDWNGDIKPGPLEIGFDYSFIIPATGDRVPCVFVEDHKVVGLDPADPIEVSYKGRVGNDPIGAEHPELLKMMYSHGHDRTIINGISRIGYMSGGNAARWIDEDIADTITGKALNFIEKHKDGPFFLYFSTHDIHVPRVPHPRFVGVSGLGPRGDAIVEMDWCVGQIMETLDRLKLTDNTLVIFSSDNGPVLDDGYVDQAVEALNGHEPAGPLSGGKYSRYEGGTRVPMLVRWPGQVKAGATSDALVCQVDFIASLASLTGVSVPEGSAPDSENTLDALLGKSEKGRDVLVEHAGETALRQGPWKYFPSAPKTKITTVVPEDQKGKSQLLFNLDNDIAERNDVAAEHPEIVKDMDQKLKEIENL